MKRLGMFAAFFLLLSAMAQLQFSGEPLIVPGSQLGWEEDELRLVLQVKKSTDLELQLYSPGFDPEDYRNPDELGDERYDRGNGNLHAYFKLAAENGRTLAEKTYGLEPHRWDTLYAGRLEPGNYLILARFSGEGKNAVAFRLNTAPEVAQIVLQPNSMQTYNVHGHGWQDPFAVNVPDYGAPLKVGVYDGDGPEELQVRHTSPNGVVRRLETPGNREWIYLTLKETGEHRFGFRRPEGAYQVTNTVGIKVFYGPVKVTIVDTAGDPVPGADYSMQGIYERTVCLRAPEQWRLVDVGFKYGKRVSPECVRFGVGGGEARYVLERKPATLDLSAAIRVCGRPTGQPAALQLHIGQDRVGLSGKKQLTLPAGRYPVSVEPVPGADVSGPQELTLQAGQRTEAEYIVSPRYQLTLKLDSTQPMVGGRAQLDARLLSSFQPDPPAGTLDLEIDWPDGLTPVQNDLLRGDKGGSEPHVVLHRRIQFTAERPGRFLIRVKTLPCGPGSEVEVVVPQPEVRQPVPELERSLDKHVVVPGEEVAVSLSVRNSGDADLSYDLRDNLPDCLEAQSPAEFTGVLAPGDSQTYHYQAKAVFQEEQQGGFRADLTSNGGDLTAPDEIRCVLVPLEKTVVDGSLAPGEQTAFVIRVQNPTDHRLKITVKDRPQPGLGLDAGERSFDLAAGAWGEWRIPVTPERAGEFRNEAAPYVNGVPAGGGSAATVIVKEKLNIVERRRSQVFLPFEIERELTDNCGGLLVAHAPPAGSSYVPGSSLLDGRPLSDPRRAADGRLIWNLPARNEGVLSYQVTHEGALPKLAEPELTAYFGASEQPLVGGLSRADYAAASKISEPPPGLIIDPKTGHVFGSRDHVTVTVRSADGKPPVLIVNGRPLPETHLGEYTENTDSGERRYVFHDVPLRPGRNSLQAVSGGERDGVQVFVAGEPARIVARPLSMVADGRTPIEVEIAVEDASGLAVDHGTVVVESSLEPLSADAAPTLSGYRVVLENGRGVLRLQPTSSPQRLELKLGYGKHVERISLQIVPSGETLWLAHGSITASYDFAGRFELGGLARGYLETPLWGGQLQGALDVSAAMPVFDTAALDTTSGLHETEEPDERFPLSGSAGEAKLPLVSDDGLAFHYDKAPLSVGYQRLRPDLPGVDGLPQMTALHLETNGNLEVRGFAALIARTTVNETIVPDGTRVYWLTQPVKPGTERISLKVGAEITDLERLRDYVIDYPSGVVFLSRPLWSQTDELLPVRLLVEYAPVTAPRDQVAAGAGLRLHLGSFSLGAGAATLDRGGNWRFGVEAAYHGPALDAVFDYNRAAGTNRFGLTASGKAGFLETRANLSLDSGAVTGKARLTAHLSPRDRVVLEHRARTSENRSEVSYERSLGASFSFGVGLGYVWESHAPELLGRARYAGIGLSAELTHAHPFGSSTPETRLLLGYAIDDNLSVKADLGYAWGSRLSGSLGLDQRVGLANLAVSYVLPNESGEGNRARFGIRAPLPLARSWYLDLMAGYDYAFAAASADAAAGAGIRYQAAGFKATLGVEGATGYSGQKLSVRSGASGQLAPEHSLGFDANYQVVPAIRGRFSLSYAYRGANLTVLTYHRLSNLTEAVLEGELATTWHPDAGFQLRPSLAYRLKLADPAGNTYQAGLAGNVYFTRYLGLGAGVYYQWQPALSADHLAFNVEASLRALDELWFNLGYTFGGFNGLTPEASPGIYLRLDLLGGAQ